MFGGIFYDFLETPWEIARGALREHLEQLQTTLTAQWAAAFNTDGTLKSSASAGGDFASPGTGLVYISNEGTNGAAKWSKVSLSDGTKGTLPLTKLPSQSAKTLLGRRSTSAGVPEEISTGDGIELSGTTLFAHGAKWSRSFLMMG